MKNEESKAAPSLSRNTLGKTLPQLNAARAGLVNKQQTHTTKLKRASEERDAEYITAMFEEMFMERFAIDVRIKE